ncbi:MAG TPA: hypothetical protein PL128_04160, partial [Ginsengibacter sp.]|nr:hypothetical protein [Ginsengibacter sp.]
GSSPGKKLEKILDENPWAPDSYRDSSWLEHLTLPIAIGTGVPGSSPGKKLEKILDENPWAYSSVG